MQGSPFKPVCALCAMNGHLRLGHNVGRYDDADRRMEMLCWKFKTMSEALVQQFKKEINDFYGEYKFLRVCK